MAGGKQNAENRQCVARRSQPRGDNLLHQALVCGQDGLLLGIDVNS